MIGKTIALGIFLLMVLSTSMGAISERKTELSDEIEVRIHPSGLFGMTLTIENIGENTVADLPWNFAYKTSIEDKGLLFNQKSENGMISSLDPGESFTVDFTPIGFGDIYFNASAGSDVLVRHQHRGFLFFIFMGPYQDTYIDISPRVAYEMMQQDMFDMIVDVSPHYEEYHLPDSVNYYIGDGSLDEVIPTLDKNLNYLVYCHVDSASVPGAQKLVDAGIENVYRLEGNYPAWVDAGYPVITPATYMDISVQEAKMLIDTNPDLIIIDVSPLYDQGHIPGAVNYYVGDGSLDAAIPTLDMNKDYLVYCHVDSASISGAQKLIDAGFDPVYRLEGNFQAWVDAGYLVE